MAWQPLGNITLSYEWQYLAVPVLRHSLFRITQVYNPQDYIYSKIVIAQAFNKPMQFYNYRAIYPSLNQKILKFVCPEEIIKDSDAIYNRYLGFKFDERFFRYSVPRSIQVEVQDAIALNLTNIQTLVQDTRENIGFIQAQLDRIEQDINTTTGQ